MEQTHSLRAGTILKGEQYTYKIEKVLGQGAFGITYLATTEIIGKFGRLPVKVAVKEYFAKDLNSRTEDGSVREASSESLAGRYGRAFQREALNLSRLDHPGIVSVLEAFQANNTWYYAMEYIEGGSLDEYIADRGGLSEQESVGAIREIGAALAFMHDHKMLHLDLKPKNIMRREDGRLVLIDFGLSKQYTADGEAESSTTIGLGTPGYAPLEQSQLGSGKFFSPALDVYALAATLFKMLTGKTPPTSSEVLNMGFPADDLRGRGVSERIIHAIETGMTPQQFRRPQSVSAFLAMLDGSSCAFTADGDDEVEATKLNGDSGTGAKSAGESVAASSVDAKPQKPPQNPSPKPSRKGLWIALASGVAALALVLLLLPKHKPGPGAPLAQEDSVRTEQPAQDAQQSQPSATQTVPEASRTGSARINSTPSGAQIWLDGKNTKKVTPEIVEDLTAGRHSVKLVLEGYTDYSGSVNITEGKRAELSQTLTAKEKPAQQQTQVQGQTNASPSTGNINGHECVDLGLSVKWATCNVGASSPSDYGNYYAWGETSTKSDYSRETLKYCTDTSGDLFSNLFSKYVPSGKSKYWSGEGTPDNRTKLVLSDDAAHSNWGGKWRMPTDTEWTELREKCKWTWTSQGGTDGYKVTGPNGNSIFLPAAGGRYGTTLDYVGSYGCYWSSSLFTDIPAIAWCVEFGSGGVGVRRDGGERSFGLSVRPVSE